MTTISFINSWPPFRAVAVAGAPSGARRTPNRLLLIATATMLALAIAAAAPALSRADDYCVHQAGFTCPAGTVDEGINLQTALDRASGNPSTASAPNVITIGPGTYQPSPAGSGFSAQTPYPLQVKGAGIGQTTLTDPAGEAVIKLVGTSRPDTVSLSGLDVRGSSQYGVFISGGTVDHVAVEPSGPYASAANGILLTDSTVKDSTVTLPAGNGGAGLYINGVGGITSNEIDDVTVEGGGLGVVANAGATIHRAKLIGNHTSLAVDSAPIYIDDSLLVGNTGLRTSDNNAEGAVQAVNDTILAASNPYIGAWSASNTSGGADITLYNSIVRGFPIPFGTLGSNATIEASNDNYDGTASGSGISVSGTVTGDPAFIDARTGDYRLAWNSPLIDAGSPALVSGDASTTDLAGNPRVALSFASSTSPLDLGAYEYQHSAPTAVVSTSPSGAAAGTPITFDGSRSSDPDDGDVLSYAWSFDDGARATGATVGHAFATPGTHTASLTVTDPTGLTSTQSITVTVPSPSSSSGTSTTTTTPAPKLIVVGKPTVTGTRVKLTLRCAGPAACTGIAIAETAKQQTLKRPVRVAFLALRLNPGQTKTITLTLNVRGSGFVKRLGKLPVAIAVSMTTGGKTATVKTAHVTLHPPKKPTDRHP